MIPLRSELIGRDAAQRALDELARRMGDLSPVWRELLADWKAQEGKVFASEGAAIGSRWPPLSPRYAEWKARRYAGRTTNVRTGSLRDAALGHGSGYVEKIAPLSVQFAITHPVAAFVNARRPIARFGVVEQMRWLRMLNVYAERAAAAVR